MAFTMPLMFFQKKFFKNHLKSFHQITMNMAEYASSWQSAAGAAEECQ